MKNNKKKIIIGVLSTLAVVSCVCMCVIGFNRPADVENYVQDTNEPNTAFVEDQTASAAKTQEQAQTSIITSTKLTKEGHLVPVNTADPLIPEKKDEVVSGHKVASADFELVQAYQDIVVNGHSPVLTSNDGEDIGWRLDADKTLHVGKASSNYPNAYNSASLKDFKMHGWFNDRLKINKVVIDEEITFVSCVGLFGCINGKSQEGMVELMNIREFVDLDKINLGLKDEDDNIIFQGDASFMFGGCDWANTTTLPKGLENVKNAYAMFSYTAMSEASKGNGFSNEIMQKAASELTNATNLGQAFSKNKLFKKFDGNNLKAAQDISYLLYCDSFIEEIDISSWTDLPDDFTGWLTNTGKDISGQIELKCNNETIKNKILDSIPESQRGHWDVQPVASDYAINLTQPAQGSIKAMVAGAEVSRAKAGDKVKIVYTAPADDPTYMYLLSTVMATGATDVVVSDDKLAATFTMPSADTDVSVTVDKRTAYYGVVDGTLYLSAAETDNAKTPQPSILKGFRSAKVQPWDRSRDSISAVKIEHNSQDIKLKFLTANYLFCQLQNCESIEGFEYADFSQCTSMKNMFNSCKKVTELDLTSFDTTKVTDMQSMFEECSSLTNINVSSFDTINVTTMNSMFRTCTKINSIDLSSFNTVNVVDMTQMFGSCSNVQTLDISFFSNQNLQNINYLFYNNRNLRTIKADDSLWDSSHEYKNSNQVFYNCNKLVGYSAESDPTFFDNVIDGSRAHVNSKLNPGYFTDKNAVLPSAWWGLHEKEDGTKTLYLSAEQTKYAVEHNDDVLYGFDSANVLPWSSDLSSITSVIIESSSKNAQMKFISAKHLFSNLRSCKTIIGLNNADFSKCGSMSYMFGNCSSFEQLDLASFNTGNVEDMSGMFFGCKNLLTLDLSYFSNTKNPNITSMFNGCTKLTTIKMDKDRWTRKTLSGENVFLVCTALVGHNADGTHSTSFADKQVIDSTMAYVDESNELPGYFTDVNYVPVSDHAINLTQPAQGSIKAMVEGTEVSRAKAGDKVTIAYTAPADDPTYVLSTVTASGATDVVIADDKMTATFTMPSADTDVAVQTDKAAWWKVADGALHLSAVKLDDGYKPDSNILNGFSKLTGQPWSAQSSSIKSVVIESNSENIKLKFNSCARLFAYLTSCASFAGFNNADFSACNSMYYMFYGCSSLKELDLQSFDTANVTTMSGLFYGCSSLTGLDLSRFDTQKVDSMMQMFQGCQAIKELDLSKFVTNKVTGFNYMFQYCISLTKVNLSSFDTSNATNMSCMFSFCTNLTSLDISSFSNKQDLDTDRMFESCTNLTTIIADKNRWTRDKLFARENVFKGCNALVAHNADGSHTTSFADKQVIDSTMAYVDESNELPGYFTDVNYKPIVATIEAADGGSVTGPTSLIIPKGGKCSMSGAADNSTVKFYDADENEIGSVKSTSNSGYTRGIWTIEQNGESIEISPEENRVSQHGLQTCTSFTPEQSFTLKANFLSATSSFDMTKADHNNIISDEEGKGSEKAILFARPSSGEFNGTNIDVSNNNYRKLKNITIYAKASIISAKLNISFESVTSEIGQIRPNTYSSLSKGLAFKDGKNSRYSYRILAKASSSQGQSKFYCKNGSSGYAIICKYEDYDAQS